MPQVRVRLNRWLRERMAPPGSEVVLVSVPEGESLLGLVHHLTTENDGIWRTIFDEHGQGLLANLLVIHNGRIVNPHDRAQALLNDGDEVMFLPLFDGG